ncbi:lipopolysaccharide assembly protein LapB [Xylophilus ampelinus]|uniref:Lipopolysaccharide assembly protein B n=1 Tax=Xylophilus ampelinus TaxID=54067 RepID=A0A318ST26_9BURK|nr:lipopolysaccharide assembly protein LapB [Xylophilus ampelinus]MCS4510557.1 lipopolysaccharide assembly protein LapB [Xylophilus ampelinus]PYE77816.1 lipopolysaccharide biosynthesis regulator YciM [Xylophilus ampelinus]
MDFDIGLGWILLGLPVAFVLGWLASRFDLRQLRVENRQAPKAYFKGLNYLLNEQQDQAIDAFIEAVQNDPDTSELHFALGNLFRRRGEYERAVRVHQHLLSRGDLGRVDRERAQHALALDFLKAGLLDRAEEALRRLEGTPFEEQARLALLAIYERSRDWEQAAAITVRLTTSGQGNFTTRRAHYLCEQAATQVIAGQLDAARTLLEQALDTAPDAPRPRIELAQLQRHAGQASESFDTLRTLLDVAPTALPLVAAQFSETAQASGRADEALALLTAYYEQSPSLDLLDAVVRLQQTAHGRTERDGRDWYVRHLEREPSLVAAAKWLAGEELQEEQFHPIVQRALDHATKPLMRFRCAACGFEAQQHFWQCPGCQTWDSYPPRRVEEL